MIRNPNHSIRYEQDEASFGFRSSGMPSRMPKDAEECC